MASSNLVSATGDKLISNAGLSGAVYPVVAATVAHNGPVSNGGLLATGISDAAYGLHSGIVSSAYPSSLAAGYYGTGSKVVFGNGLYSGHGIYSTNTNSLNAHGLHANGLLSSTTGLR